MTEGARPQNRLSQETSPYLLAHASNPVDWYAWGDDALERARREDKPILLSIGYAACHWCHVMERESFENEATAALMNEHYVCIKVDREERPDLDDVYMAATIAMTGQGGWPMTVFLTPEQKPFFAGTYFPPEDRYGRPGFPRLLARIAEVFREDRTGVEEQAGQLTKAVVTQLETLSPGEVAPDLAAQATAELARAFDPSFGGFSGAPKFPAAATLRMLLRHHARSGDPDSLQMALKTLDAMRSGGMYDHLGGGFARYSTDERWHVPHFEKMLYDNALLVRPYLEAFQITGRSDYARVVTETLDYLLRDMQAEGGGFCSSTDADSEGIEGKFFTFTYAELQQLLPARSFAAFCAHYDVRPEGNWEHTNVLWTPRGIDEVARELALSPPELEAMLAEAREVVRLARDKRVHPLRDDKVLVSWNAFAISAFAEASRVLSRPDYRKIAEAAARRILEGMRRPDGGLYRTSRADKTHLAAYLEDYAHLGQALIDVYESGGEERYLHEADALCTRMLADFYDPERGSFGQTAHGEKKLIARASQPQDGALPSDVAAAAMLALRISIHFERPQLRGIAERTLESYGALLSRAPRAFASLLALDDLLRHGPVEIALVGDAEGAEGRALWQAIARTYLPARALAHLPPGKHSDLALLRGKTPCPQQARAFVCRGYACQIPADTPETLEAQLAAVGLTAPRTSA